MPHINPYEAATDEPKTYQDELIRDDSNDLSDIKGDLVAENDQDVQRSYEKKSPVHQNEGAKENISGGHQLNSEAGRLNFPYPPHFDRFAPSISHPFFQGNFLPSSTQVPYSHYVPPYMGSFFCGPASSMDRERKQGMPGIPYPEVNPMYPLPGQLGQIPNPLAPWPASSLYPLCTAAMTSMLRYPYPFHHFSSSGAVPGVPPFPRPSLPTNGLRPHSGRPENHPGRHQVDMNKANEKKSIEFTKRSKSSSKSNRPYVKKPLNAFMIYMKEQRARVVAECTLKESAAINQILGKKWHSLDRDEQQKYYEMARKERQLHMQLHPSWSARDNYGKRKKRKKEKIQDCTGLNAKKCRAVFGLEQQHLWCAPCRRKKKCIRTHPDGEDSDDSDSSMNQYQLSPDCEVSQSQPMGAFDSTTPSHVGQSQAVNFPQDCPPSQSTSGINVKREVFEMNASSSRLTSTESSTKDSSTTSSNAKKPNPSLPGREFEESLRKLTNSFSLGHHANDKNNFRANSTSDLSSSASYSSTGGKPNPYASPLLSPSSINLSSPTSNPALLPNLSYLAAAAGIPASPLGNLIGFPNFNGLAPSLHLGLGNPPSPIGPINHVTSTTTHNASSALEGRS